MSFFCYFSRIKPTLLCFFQPINSRFTPGTAVFQTHRLSLIASPVLSLPKGVPLFFLARIFFLQIFAIPL